MTLSRLATPTASAKARMLWGVYPRLLSPQMVGMRGSSHPATYFCSTSSRSLRLLMRV